MPLLRSAWSGIRNGVGRTPKGDDTGRRSVPGPAILLAVGAMALLMSRPAQPIAPLTGNWSCGAYASCVFTITSNNHPAYQLNYGDGTFSGVKTTRMYTHLYSIPTGPTLKHFTVYIMAYGTIAGGSPDNIIGCTVTTYNAGVGGDPTNFSGSCS